VQLRQLENQVQSLLEAGKAGGALALFCGARADIELAYNAYARTAKHDEDKVRTLSDNILHILEGILLSPDLSMQPRDMLLLLQHRELINNVIELSSRQSSSYLRKRILPDDAQEQAGYRKRDVVLYLCVATYKDFSKVDLLLLRQLEPTIELGILLSLIAVPFTHSAHLEGLRKKIHNEFLKLPESADISPWFGLCPAAAMACSYASFPDKHKVRHVINSLLAKPMREALPNLHAHKQAHAGKPRLLVIAESFAPDHAMYRCYAPSIRALRQHFHVTMMTPALEDAHGKLAGLVDEFVSFPIESDHQPFFEHARDQAPDIVYYPSIGMTLLSLLGASIRLAPVQVMSNGHPATSMSPEIDYMVLVDEVFGGEHLYSETLLLRPKGAHYVRHSEFERPEPVVRRSPDVVRIAVPAYLKKLNAHFLDACRQIAEANTKPVEFWFFPNRVASDHLMAKRRLEKLLPCRVIPRKRYMGYLRKLSQCDIHLSPFPFGSANGIVDSLSAGLPVVNMIGEEAHSRLDANLVNRTTQPEWLTVKTPEDYVSACLRLIEDDDLRVKISEGLCGVDPLETMVLDEGVGTPDFGILLLKAYKNHRHIQKTGKKVWHLEELSQLK